MFEVSAIGKSNSTRHCISQHHDPCIARIAIASQCCPQLPKNPSSGLSSSFAYHDTFSSKKLQPCTPAYALSNKKLKSTKKGIPNDSKKNVHNEQYDPCAVALIAATNCDQATVWYTCRKDQQVINFCFILSSESGCCFEASVMNLAAERTACVHEDVQVRCKICRLNS